MERRELVAEIGGDARRRYIRGTFGVNFGREGAELNSGRREFLFTATPLRLVATSSRRLRHNADRVLSQNRNAADRLPLEDAQRIS